MASSTDDSRPTASFSAVSSSARQLFLLLRCIGFAPKALVQITAEGLRFTVEDSRVMQGLAFLDKALFTTYNYQVSEPEPPSPSSASSSSSSTDHPPPLTFQISLTALLETLQIFTTTDPLLYSRSSNPSTTFPTTSSTTNSNLTNHLSPPPGLCQISHPSPTSPLSIILSEAGCTTTCALTTYLPPPSSLNHDIPLSRDTLLTKIIMRASWLHDAITELAATSPSRLVLTASPTAPYFALSARGALGTATVEFNRDNPSTTTASHNPDLDTQNPLLLETFQVRRRSTNSYRFASVRHASRAMSVASKVSIRGDAQGVLSLQFMVEVEGGGVSFVDFRFVPLLEEEGEDEAECGSDEAG